MNAAAAPSKPTNSLFKPIAALLLGATSWGILWYPFRVMQQAGLGAPLATFAAYLFATIFGMLLLHKHLGQVRVHWRWLAAIGVAAGITNVSYLVGVMHADVVRIVLLFYLAPLWTVPLAHFILHEKLNWQGAAVVVLALCGAAIMLWRPAAGFPAPANIYEWLGLLAGFFFALCNVLVKAADHISAEIKSLGGAAGVMLVALPTALALGPAPGDWVHAITPHVGLLLFLGVVLITTSFAFQYGLTHLSANHAAVILLFELIVAAVAAHFLAGEQTRGQDWIGGVLIVLAGMITTFFRAREPVGDGYK
jgi:drug/metabolite transporter (DMT)-like permease